MLHILEASILQKIMKHYFYFTPVKGNFAAAQICSVEDYYIEKNAELWKKTNGFAHVFVYDLNHKFIREC